MSAEVWQRMVLTMQEILNPSMGSVLHAIDLDIWLTNADQE